VALVVALAVALALALALAEADALAEAYALEEADALALDPNKLAHWLFWLIVLLPPTCVFCGLQFWLPTLLLRLLRRRISRRSGSSSMRL
jgi:hypothetical protein